MKLRLPQCLLRRVADKEPSISQEKNLIIEDKPILGLVTGVIQTKLAGQEARNTLIKTGLWLNKTVERECFSGFTCESCVNFCLLT